MLIIILVTILLSLILAPLGCLILWKKYVYFSDGLAHATMFSVIIGTILNIHIIYASLINSLLFIYLIFIWKKRNDNNAVIGLVSSLLVGLSLLLANLFPNSLNLNNLLFGEIILVSWDDVILLSVILLVNLIFFYLYYEQLILSILSKEIALVRGVNVSKLEFIFLIILSFVITIAIKIVGVLLVTAIILIPAMTGRILANSPISMLIIATILALFNNLVSLVIAMSLDLALAPIIIIFSVIVFILINNFHWRGK